MQQFQKLYDNDKLWRQFAEAIGLKNRQVLFVRIEEKKQSVRMPFE